MDRCNCNSSRKTIDGSGSRLFTVAFYREGYAQQWSSTSNDYDDDTHL